jgi:hypothetical protein
MQGCAKSAFDFVHTGRGGLLDGGPARAGRGRNARSLAPILNPSRCFVDGSTRALYGDVEFAWIDVESTPCLIDLLLKPMRDSRGRDRVASRRLGHAQLSVCLVHARSERSEQLMLVIRLMLHPGPFACTCELRSPPRHRHSCCGDAQVSIAARTESKSHRAI